MPIYEIAGKRINAQNPLSEEEIDEIHNSITKEQQPKEDQGWFSSALGRSWHSAKEAAQGVGLGITAAIDTPEHTRQYVEESKALQNEELPGPKSMSFEDLQNVYKDKGILSGIAETPKFAAQKFAESSLETAVPLIVGGIAGAFTGGTAAPLAAGIATSIIQQFGHDMARQAQENVNNGLMDPASAIEAAIPQGALDYLSDRFTLGMKLAPGAKDAIANAAKEEVKKSLFDTLGGRVAKGMVRGAASEAPTEAGQQYLERLQAGLPTDNEEAWKEYKEAAGSAAAAGALGGGATSIFEKKEQPNSTNTQATGEIPEETFEETPEETVNTSRPSEVGKKTKPSDVIVSGKRSIDRNAFVVDKEGLLGEEGAVVPAGEYYDAHLNSIGKNTKHSFNSTNKRLKEYQDLQSKQEDQGQEDQGQKEQGQEVVTPPQDQNIYNDKVEEEDVPSTFEEEGQKEAFVPTHILYDVATPRNPNRKLNEPIPVQEIPSDPEDLLSQTTFLDQHGNKHTSDITNDIQRITKPEEQGQQITDQNQGQNERASAASDTSAPLGASSTQGAEEQGQEVVTPPPEEKKTTAPKRKANVKAKLPKETITKANEVVKKVEDQIASGTEYAKTPNALIGIAKDLNIYNAGWTPAQQLTAVKDRLGEAQELGIAHTGDIFPDILANTNEALGLDKKQSEEDEYANLTQEEIDKLEETKDKELPKNYAYDKGYTPTKEPSAENFLNQNSLYNTTAPKTVNNSIDHAAFSVASDKIDEFKIDKKTPQNRQEYIANRDAFVGSLNNKQRAVYDKKVEEHYKKALKAKEFEGRERYRTNNKGEVEEFVPNNEKETIKSAEDLVDEFDDIKIKEKTAKIKATQLAKDIKEYNEVKNAPVVEKTEAPKRERVKLKNKITTALDNIMQNPVFPSIGDVSILLNAVSLSSSLRSTRAVADRLLVALEAIDNRTGALELPKVVYGELDGNDGSFNPKTNTITIKGSVKDGYTGERSLDEVVLHELAHYLTDHVIDNPTNYIKSLTNSAQQARVKEGIARLKNLHKVALADLTIKDNFEIPTLKEFIAETISNREFQLALGNMPYVSDKSFGEKFNSFFNSVVKAISKALGFENTSKGVALEDALDDIFNLVSRPTEKIKGKKISFAKQAPPLPLGGAFANLDRQISLAGQRKENNKDITGSATTSTYRQLVHAFQNASVYLKNWQNQLEHAGLIISDPTKKFTNINDLKTLAQELGRVARKEYILPVEDQIIKDVNKLTALLGIDDNQTLNLLHNFRTGLNGQERRRTSYYLDLNRKLDTALKLKDASGAAISPEAYRDEILKLSCSDKKLSKKQAENLWSNVEWVVDNYSMPDPNAAKIDNDRYNTLGITYQQEQRILQDYNDLGKTNPAAKALVDNIFDSMEKLNANTITLNKKSNYHSSPVDNIINFYGWKHYSPFKGVPEHNALTSSFNRDNLLTSNTFRDMADPWTGGIDDSENCLVQTITDAYKAADRAGYGDVTQGVKNASETVLKGKKLLNAKTTQTLSFADREQFKELGQKVRERCILHYNKDGSVDIIEFDPSALPILNSIRKQYVPTNSVVNTMSALTSTIAQMHTRYNVNFAPMNFFRDMLTNAWTMGAEKGMGMSAKYISIIVGDVFANGGIAKAGKIARLYEKNDIPGIRAIAKGKDSFEKHIAEYILHGGKVSHRAAMSLKENYDRMEKIGDKKYLAHTMDSFNTIIDTYNEMFELSSRASAFKTFKSNYISEGMSPETAGIKAAADAKNLANFEQVGIHSKTLGAFFMFSRPAATGAVRALDALLPAVTSEKQALKNLDNSGVFAYEVDPNTHKRTYKNQKAVDEYLKSFKVQKANARIMASSLIGMGMATYAMAAAMSDDDDKGRNKVANDNPDQWTKFARFHTGDGNIVQIPWGFGLGAFAAIGAQIAMVSDPRNKVDLKTALSNIATQISFDSYLPIPISRIDFMDDSLKFAVDSVTPSLGRPLVEYVMNKNGLGQSIYSNSPSGGQDNAYSGGDKVPEMYKTACRWLADVTDGGLNIAPNSAYFFANNYVDGIARLGEIGVGQAMLATGKKEFEFRKDVPFLGSFSGAEANVDAREFGKIEEKIKAIRSDLDMFKSNPKEYREYIDKNPMAPAIVEIYDKIKGSYLDKLYHINNVYRENPNFSPKERKQLIKPITDNINTIKGNLVRMMEQYDVHPY
jgi:hypothetical protein